MTKNLFLVLLFAVQTAFAQIISKDPNFANNGIYTMPGNLTWSMVQNSNNEIYFTHNLNVGTGINVTGSYLSKLTANGITDANFGVNGTVQLPNNSYLNEIKIQPDGKLVIFGFTNTESIAISRILPNGQFDPAFGTNGTTIITSFIPDQDYASYGIILQNDKILVHAIKSIQNQHVIMRLNTNGSLDTTFGSNGYATTQGNIAGRTFVRTDNQSNIICFNSNGGFIQKFTPNGQPLTSFGNNGVVPLLDSNGFGYGSTSTILVDTNNKILFSLSSDDKILRINQDGTFDTTFNYHSNTNSGLNGGAWIQSIAEKDGSYYVGGAGNLTNLISKLTQNGSVDPLFNDYLQTDSDVEQMFISDNNIMIRGNGYIVKYLLNNATLSTADIKKVNDHISFENPIKQNLVYQSKEKVSKIEVYSLDGKFLKTIKNSGLPVSDLPKGIYIAKVSFENGSGTIRKLIKN
ncbi:T9SS C-terminal target domain-containing protein [Chryseobacterium sp. G0186]|uniref:T9SS type A sorting domain-containing protein n=1 Tax=Chryseobacterium sp. G0186 TaxID=2487064 RepID=UPI000F4F8D91|nr:T9SS type A sorting domain-containing protein [Chryseobacterium sp. G0186]AZA79525.1 T9SS C-terminal target domain-containing protein [Chryseobacterium sp. G0186]